MSNSKPFKCLITHPEVPEEALNIMRKACEVIICENVPPSREEILQKVAGVHAILWATNERLDTEILDAAGKNLTSVSTMSAGIDNIDVDELKKRQIPLGHTPSVLNSAVADVAVGLMLAAMRRFHEGREKIANNKWENYHLNWMLGRDMRDATVGFFGFGGIGQTIAKRLPGFEIGNILYTARCCIGAELERKLNAKRASFADLLMRCDVLFITAPLTPETEGAFNASAFAKMKPTAVLINVARGAIVDQGDLYTALKNNQIFAAGLDVTTPEPLPARDPLMTLPNCIIVPHLGSATERTRTEMACVAAHNILRGLVHEPMLAPAY